ncbi:icarapin-like [Nylanderia fulva]|uniref:icarapin-like n=1 Tax=Nylanderia fulva TaxID=613905 RepID=UPI0010FAE598|nr:icarapin-like [Nylanderia fulva]
MKTYVTIVVACLIACAHTLPSARRDDDSLEDFDSFEFSFPDANFFADALKRMRESFMDYFWHIPILTDVPEGANTTSTTKIINGHVVTINETTYTSGDENGGTAFRIRIIDVKPENDTLQIGGENTEPTTVKVEATGSAETVEDFANEIPNKTDVLTA